jgi:hypothetical protein
VNLYPYDHKCQSSRRVGKVKHATKFWIQEKIKDWLAKDPTVRPKELRRRLKDDWKVSISYKKCMIERHLLWKSCMKTSMKVLTTCIGLRHR